MARLRRIASPLATAVAAATLAIGLTTLYLDREIVDSERFAERAAHALEDERVRREIAVRLSDALVEAEPDLVAARALIESGAEAVVETAAFQSLFQRAVQDLHGAVFEGERDAVVLKLSDVALLVVDALRVINPDLAERVPEDVEATLLAVSEGDAVARLAGVARAGESNRRIAWIATLAALLLLAGAVALAHDRRRAVRRAGVAVAGAGLAVVVVFHAGRALLPSLADVGGDEAVRSVWNALLLDLRSWSLAVAAAGLAVAAAAAALLRPIDLEEPARFAWTTLTRTPQRRSLRGLRAAVLALVGVVAIVGRDTVLELAVVGFGALLLYIAVSELIVISLPRHRVWTEDDAEIDVDEIADALEQAGRRVRLRLRRARLRLRRVRPRRPQPEAIAATTVVALVVSGAVAAAIAFDGEERAPIELRACNGRPELCERRLDEVAYAATHNAMGSAEDRDWLFPQQDDGLRRQLDAGIRALLLDTHYGVRTPRGVYTLLAPGTSSRAKLAEALGERFVATAERLRDRIGYRGGGKREIFLCHAYCELGALEAGAALRELREWLVAHPHEVVIVSLEDATRPADTAAVFRRAGLDRYVYAGSARPPFPTLRHLIESGRRLVVLAESGGAGVPWLLDQFAIVQETPYSFRSASELAAPGSCAPNRGPRDAPLFLVNHWVDTSPAPRPSNAARVNELGFLTERLDRCRRERGRLPNLVAVDFHRQGDVLEAVDRLNRVAPAR